MTPTVEELARLAMPDIWEEDSGGKVVWADQAEDAIALAVRAVLVGAGKFHQDYNLDARV